MFITGPVNSSGRSGLSWGSDSATNWDTVFWDATKDIVFNVEEATALGFKCFYICWANDESAKRINIPNLELIPIEDPFFTEDIEINLQELSSNIRNFGPLVKNLTFNDQRQALASQFGFTYLLDLGYEISLRIRSDQRMNWSHLSTDLAVAYSSKRILFPAQRGLTCLDSGYTGFTVLDFFYGGETRLLAEWFSHVLVGGRVYGPHQDIIWKPLINSFKWKRFFPGMTILSDINNSKKQLTMARVFWKEFACPSSKESMNAIIWRGSQLKPIDYEISRNDPFFNRILRSNQQNDLIDASSGLPRNFAWDLLANYLIGGTVTGKSTKNIGNEILLDHLKFLVTSNNAVNGVLILHILQIIIFHFLKIKLLSARRRVRRLVGFPIKKILKLRSII
jgi:hypothetical protein